MNSLKKAFCIAFFLIFPLLLFAQPSLCNEVYNFLKANKLSPTTQQLVSSASNQFPYNIQVDFETKKLPANSYFYTPKNLYLVFFQEEVLENKEIFTSLAEFINQKDFGFNISFLFLYGENQLVTKDGMIYGSDIFLKNINTNEDSTAIIVNLQSKSSSILSNSSGISSPSWLIKNEHDIFHENKVPSKLPFYYISQLYKYKFNHNHQLDSFFKAGLPSIVLNFSSTQTISTQIIKILEDSISAFSLQENRIWDQHFLMISIMGSYFLLSEETIVKIIIFIIVIFLLFIAILGFVNINLQKDAWSKIKKIWYVVPITFILVLLSLYCGKITTNLFLNDNNPAKNIYILFGFQLFFAFILTTVYFFIQILHNDKYEIRSVDFLIVITIFINQFIFLFVDISLFPVFMFMCFLSILALGIKNNIVHIVIFIIMFLPFILYAHNLIQQNQIKELFNFLYNKNFPILFITLVLYPIFLIYFRILTAFKKNSAQKKSLYLTGGITLGSVIIFLFILGTVRTNQLSKTINEQNQIIFSEIENQIKISYSDKKVFNDIVRTVNVKLPKQSLQCKVIITTENNKPILYSSDDYEVVSANQAFFQIPYCPPQNLTFTYGTEDGPSTIQVTAIFPEDSKEQFSISQKSITINTDGKN